MKKREMTYDFRGKQRTRASIRWQLVCYDLIVFLIVGVLFLLVYPAYGEEIDHGNGWLMLIASCAAIFAFRFLFRIYHQVWRYAHMSNYIRLIAADALGGLTVLIIREINIFPRISLVRTVGFVSMDLLLVMSLRIIYQYMYQTMSTQKSIKLLRKAFYIFTGMAMTEYDSERTEDVRIKVAIIGAGQVGVSLAEELNINRRSPERPVCFVDNSSKKAGRMIAGLPVLSEQEEDLQRHLLEIGVQEVVVAIPDAGPDRKREIYEIYSAMGLRVKMYDYPTMQSNSVKRQLREVNVEELLFRTPKDFLSEETKSYYRNKVIMITGGGGSIGSEIARQLAKMTPKQLVIYDIYENGAYDLQQELTIKYGKKFDLRVEISTMCDIDQLDQIIGYFRPDIVIHAAAHKHVPLMQQNAIEGVKNNVFGTENLLAVCEKYGVGRFMMVSTDKAVNPTNVMGATKRMCEMMVLNHPGNMIVSATRFGNVLGSAGSVVPLFYKQIKSGGPITITDKRIIRYFMTIPEASQLVLTSGAMAKNRELFVLDMGKPVRILDLAENMVRLSGLEPYRDIDIIETGLRPGEKLYEELLIKGENLKKTENEMIFIEQQERMDYEEILEKLKLLHAAADTKSPREIRETLKVVVPTYHSAEEVNANASESAEMKLANEKK